ncbi:MAG: porphobilinogen synthase [Anaerolineae bacterium]
MGFPYIRPRRLRATPTLREMVRETQLTPQDFIYPMFTVHGEAVRRPVSSMPGVYQLSVDQLVREAQECHTLSIPAVILFGVPAHKDAQGSENFSDDGIVQRAIRAIKATLPQMIVIADVCMCEYTDHGHCGIVRDGQIDNDATLEILGRAAISYARAGADIVAPSGMMDGMVAAIRGALDEAGFSNVSILSYAIKYASAFYGPFREAAEGAPKFGDRKTHQMDPANAREALRELELDIEEGADMVMVKPALPYLDIVYRVRQATYLPVAAYNVSGEYAMVKAAAANSWLDERSVVLELLTSIKRAGADLILTYHAKDAARWLAGM